MTSQLDRSRIEMPLLISSSIVTRSILWISAHRLSNSPQSMTSVHRSLWILVLGTHKAHHYRNARVAYKIWWKAANEMDICRITQRTICPRSNAKLKNHSISRRFRLPINLSYSKRRAIVTWATLDSICKTTRLHWVYMETATPALRLIKVWNHTTSSME